MELESYTDENHSNDHHSSRKFYNLLPSKRKAVLTATQTVVLVFLYASLYGILGDDALPGSEIFALLLLSVSAHIVGKLVSLIKLPPLIGMLIVGFLFRNLPFIPYYQNISILWATTLRAAAFVVILLKAGLGLDAEKLKSLKLIVFQLAFSPCIVETIVLGISSHFLLNLPWAWAIMLGFVISAVSPAVVVPGLLSLQERSFGIRKGIPTLVIAAASVDDILAITGFTIMLSISLSAGDSLWVTVLKGLLEPIGGLLYGVLFGSLFWLIPSSQSSSSTQAFYHVVLLCLGGFAGMFLSKRLGVAGLGPMACLVLAFVASLGWKKDPQHLEQIERIIGVMWIILQPFLFNLIGAEVSVRNLQSNLGNTVLALLIGFTFRIITAAFASYGGGFNVKERLFIAIAWFPKATVQAAVGPQALDYVLSNNMGKELEDQAQKILTGAVLSIIMTAPIGAALIALLGPLLLSQDKPKEKDASEMDGDSAKNECRI
ncbi:Sodium/hydrogen exchanger 9B1 [Araneus ventricosus]|uniref:Sodium/hydrogen exchanger 9B1 n=1 Tax=Araneus ventricosus TaxID=182803 RepID=A0A4Y2N5T5_ARAVE|nr:Sodium/hydrogen exchanger 9B1 [Araneus ventricosus]